MTPIEVLNEKGIKVAVKHLNRIQGHDREKLLLSVFAARKVQHLLPDDSSCALDVIERYANGLATKQELEKAFTVARAAYIAARNYADVSAVDVDCDVSTAAHAVVFATYATYAVSIAAFALNSEEKQKYWQSIEAKFRELFEEK